MARSQESASTPISAGGWRYNHDDEQDRTDFANHTSSELANLEANAKYDFSDHPNRPLELRSDTPGWYAMHGVALNEIITWLGDLGQYLADLTDGQDEHPARGHQRAAENLHYELTLARHRADSPPRT